MKANLASMGQGLADVSHSPDRPDFVKFCLVKPIRPACHAPGPENARSCHRCWDHRSCDAECPFASAPEKAVSERSRSHPTWRHQREEKLLRSLGHGAENKHLLAVRRVI